MNRLSSSVLLAGLWSVAVAAHAAKPPRTPENPIRIYRIGDGTLVIPALDPRNQLNRPDLREDKSPPLPDNFQETFLDHEGISSIGVFWVYSPETGHARSIKTTELKLESPDWGESSGSLENLRFTAGLSETECRDRQCLAIVSLKNPFAGPVAKAVTFGDPPKAITAETLGIQSSDFERVRLLYSKRPDGAELVVAQMFKHDTTVNCGEGGIAKTETGYVQVNGTWSEVYSKFEQLEDMDLQKIDLSTLRRPTATSGVPVKGSEVILLESTFLFLDKGSATITPIREPGIGVCGC